MIKLFLFQFGILVIVFPKTPRLIKGHNITIFKSFFPPHAQTLGSKDFFATEINEILRMYQECTRAFNFENGKLNTMIEQLFTCK